MFSTALELVKSLEFRVQSLLLSILAICLLLLITHNSTFITPVYADASTNKMSLSVDPSHVAAGQSTSIKITITDPSGQGVDNAQVNLKIYFHDKNSPSAVNAIATSKTGGIYTYSWTATQDKQGDTNNEDWTVAAWSDQTPQNSIDNAKTQTVSVTPPTGGGTSGGTSGVVPAGISNYTPHVHTGFTLENVVSNLAGCWTIEAPLIGGTTTGNTTGCPFFDPQGNLQVAYKPGFGGGAIGGVSKIMVAMYAHPSLSSTEYLADVGRNLGIVKPALAQGIGVGGTGDQVLLPILSLWKVFRNLAYLIFIVIFVFVGLMIMFRKKINPQTVISVQSALPGLVIGLALVTFSYLIAAFIVDLSYVGMSLVGFIFIQSGLGNTLAPLSDGSTATINPTAVTDLATNANIFGLGWEFIHNNLLNGTLIPYFTNLFDITGNIPAAQSQGFLTNIITGNFGAALAQIGQTAANIALTGAGLLVSAILIVAVLIQMFKLLWQMVSAYIAVLIFAIAGPLFIVIGSIPGKNAAITYWWKTLLANILIFPAIFAVIMFAGTFLANVSGFTKALPLFNGIPTNILSAIIGYGLILGSPAVPGMVKQALGVKDITALQQAAFGGVGAGAGLYGAGAKELTKPIALQRQAYREASLREKYTDIAKLAPNARKEALRNRPWLTLWNRF